METKKKKATSSKQPLEVMRRVHTNTAILEVIKNGEKYIAARTRKSDRAATTAEYDTLAEAEAALGLGDREG